MTQPKYRNPSKRLARKLKHANKMNRKLVQSLHSVLDMNEALQAQNRLLQGGSGQTS